MKKLTFALLAVLGLAGLNATQASVSTFHATTVSFQDSTAKKDTTAAPKPAPTDSTKTKKPKQ